MTPVPPHNLDPEKQLEYIRQFMIPDSDSTTVSVKLDYQGPMLESLLSQISQIMAEEHDQETYETLILDRFEQNTIVKVLWWERDPYGPRVMTFYQTLDED